VYNPSKALFSVSMYAKEGLCRRSLQVLDFEEGSSKRSRLAQATATTNGNLFLYGDHEAQLCRYVEPQVKLGFSEELISRKDYEKMEKLRILAMRSRESERN
jgi:hypothetical protein